MNESPTDKATPANTRAILQDCRGIAARRLPAIIYEVLKQIKADLMEIAPSTQKYELFALYREALDITQGRWSLIESRFRTHFLDRFDRECRQQAANTVRKTNAPRIAEPEEFKLMDADDLEESLAANTLANAMKSLCVNELMGLNPRVGTLLKDPEFLNGLNPLGPEVIGEALMETLQELEGSIKAKLVLVPLFSKYLPARVQTVYQEINQHLYNKGILPSLQVHSRKGAPTKEATSADDNPGPTRASTSGKSTGGGGGGGGGNGGGGGSDLFAMLQQLMTLGRIGGPGPATRGEGPVTQLAGNTITAPAAAPMVQGAPEIPARAGLVDGLIPGTSQTADPPVIFINQLTRLQQGETDGIAVEGLTEADIGDGRVNVLHSLRESESARGLTQVDSMTLDIVALLFDFILDDRRIPDAMKAVIGRLQIPLLKVALLDKSLFANKSHPARQVLDAMAKAAMGWNAEEGHDSSLYIKINAMVMRIIKEFTNDIGLFEAVLKDLNEFLEQEHSGAAAAAAQAAERIQKREQAERPRLAAREEIQRRLEFQALPKMVRKFLNHYWEPLLVKIYSSQGPESDTWIKAITTMDDLIWSVTPKNTSQDRKKLLVILPKLLKWLDQGLQFLNVPQDQRDPFFHELVKYHTEAVRPGLDDEQFAREFDIAIGKPSENTPIIVDPEDFEIIPPPPSAEDDSKHPDPVLVEEIAQTFEPEEEAEEIVIGDVSWASGDIETDISPIDKDYGDMVRGLKRGTWIELDQDNGECLRAKLAWVSPLRGVYLFTNRLGQKAISINASGLAAKFREGRVRLIDNVPLMDRAVSGLIDRLQKSVP